MTDALPRAIETAGDLMLALSKAERQLEAVRAALRQSETRLHWLATTHDSLGYVQDRARAYRDEARAALAQTEGEA